MSQEDENGAQAGSQSAPFGVINAGQLQHTLPYMKLLMVKSIRPDDLLMGKWACITLIVPSQIGKRNCWSQCTLLLGPFFALLLLAPLCSAFSVQLKDVLWI